MGCKGPYKRCQFTVAILRTPKLFQLAQSAIEAIEKNKKETEASMQRKEKELLAMADKLEEEQGEVVKAQKQIKDMSVS